MLVQLPVFIQGPLTHRTRTHAHTHLRTRAFPGSARRRSSPCPLQCRLAETQNHGNGVPVKGGPLEFRTAWRMRRAQIRTIEAPLLGSNMQQLTVRFHRRPIHEDSGVEAVRPPRVGRRGEFLSLKEVVHVCEDLTVQRGEGKSIAERFPTFLLTDPPRKMQSVPGPNCS